MSVVLTAGCASRLASTSAGTLATVRTACEDLLCLSFISKTTVARPVRYAHARPRPLGLPRQII